MIYFIPAQRGARSRSKPGSPTETGYLPDRGGDDAPPRSTTAITVPRSYRRTPATGADVRLPPIPEAKVAANDIRGRADEGRLGASSRALTGNTAGGPDADEERREGGRAP